MLDHACMSFYSINKYVRLQFSPNLAVDEKVGGTSFLPRPGEEDEGTTRTAVYPICKAQSSLEDVVGFVAVILGLVERR